MNTCQCLSQPSPVQPSCVKRLLLAAASFGMLGSSLAACASVPTYNPDHLQAAQFARVSDICQTVMGLNPKEPLIGGDWMGEPRIDYATSHYRVCVLSLSDSLLAAADVQLTQNADAACRGKGLVRGSSDLALCVLQQVNDRSARSEPAQVAADAAILTQLPQAPTSYYRASPHDYVRREQLACAAIDSASASSGQGVSPRAGCWCRRGSAETVQTKRSQRSGPVTSRANRSPASISNALSATGA